MSQTQQYVNYIITLKSKHSRVRYTYNTEIKNVLLDYDNILHSYGVYFNQAYFTKNVIECDNMTLFVTLTEDVEQDFVINKSVKLEKTGYELISFDIMKPEPDNNFVLVSPMIYAFPVNSVNCCESGIENAIYTPDVIQSMIKEELLNTAIFSEPKEELIVKFKTKYRSLKSVESFLGNKWGYGGQIETKAKIIIPTVGIGSEILRKNGYNCIIRNNVL